MNLNAIRTFFGQWYLLLMIGLVLAGCGGGGGPAATTTSSTTAIAGSVTTANGGISVSLATSAGVSTNIIPANGYLIASATVVNANGVAQQNVLVTFTVSNNTVATMAPPSGTALTNSAGIAQIHLVGGSTGGAAALTVSAVPVTSTAVTATLNFAATVPVTTSSGSLSVYLANTAGLPTTTMPTSGNLVANAQALDANGNPVSGVLVTFTVSDSTVGVLVPSNGTALTNSTGWAQVTLASSSSAGAGTVTASANVTAGSNVVVSSSTNFSSGGPSAVSSPTIKLSLLNSNGVVSSSISTSGVYTVAAKVTDSSGNPVANTLVTFTSTTSLTSLIPSAGTALTNGLGIASIVVAPLNLATAIAQTGAAGFVNASATVSTQAISATIPFTMGNTTITLQLISPTGVTAVNAYASLPIQVEVYSNNLLYTAQPVLVNFSSACATSGKATLSPSASTINGIAQVTYTDKGCSSTDLVTASVAGATPVVATLNVAAPTAASVGFVSATPSDKSIVIAGSGGNGRSQTAVLTFEVFDNNGNGLANQVVTFSVNNGTSVVLLNTPNGTTGATGTVQATVNSQSTAGTFRVIATLASSGQSAISDTVVVTTGQPVQAAFSLSALPYNIEGWNYDNVQSILTALIADANGNPVADGTPVVTSTDSGAVGTSGIGGCVTLNGGCTVTFRSQNPRNMTTANGKRAGMATVSFASTNQTTTPLTGTVNVFLSGSAPVNYYVNGVSYTQGNLVTLASAACSYVITLELDDINYNPLPFNTSVAVVNTTSGVTAGTIYPTTVPSIAPWSTILTDSATTHHGSIHYIPLQFPATSCNVSGNPAGASNTFSVLVATPLGTGTLINFKITNPF